MRNRKCNTELKGITLEQSILCLKHEWTGEISEDLNEFQSSVLYNEPISQSCNDIIGMYPPGILGKKPEKRKKEKHLTWENRQEDTKRIAKSTGIQKLLLHCDFWEPGQYTQKSTDLT